MNRYLSLAPLLCAAVLSACEKNAVQELTEAAPVSRIRFFNFGVNAPGVNFYANDTKMTAITSGTGVESTTGTIYGGVGAGGFYSGITPGDYTVRGRIAAATDKDLAISNVPVSISDGKFYSFYQSGFYNTTTKTVDGFVVEDPVPALDLTVAYVRFVNAISNSSPMAMSAKNSAGVVTPIGGAVAYKAAGAFTAVPNGVYDLTTRVTGAATDAISRTAVSLSAGRVYTISARGDMTVTSTTATNRPFLDNTTNR
ncbi:MAG: DUF4397 domain-containing protein [Gemmatimonadales bacterium]